MKLQVGKKYRLVDYKTARQIDSQMNGPGFSDDMIRMFKRGEKVTISHKKPRNENHYHITEDGGFHYWLKDWFITEEKPEQLFDDNLFTL